MQLLDSCPLPQVQFASLSILLQLHLNDDDIGGGGSNTDGAPNTYTNDGGMPHNSTTPKEYMDGNSCNITLDEPKSAGEIFSSLAALQQQHAPRFAVLKESLSVLSPMTILPENACHQCLTSLHINLMEEYNMRDDFVGVNVADITDDDNIGNSTIAASGAINKGDEVPEEEKTATMRRGSSRVRFHDDTKEGSMENTNVKGEERTSGSINYSKIGIPSFESQLIVRAYQPPTHHMNCSLGMTLFYVAVPVEDVTKIAAGVDNNDPQRKSREDAAEGTFQNCLAALLPEITLQDLSKLRSSANVGGRCRAKNSGIVLLTVGVSGPAYDLFGVSSIVSTISMRLRECMATLAMVGTTPTERNQTIQSMAPQSSQPLAHQGSVTSKGKKKSRGAKEISVAITPQSQQQSSLTEVVAYDSEYFQRLYMALLATLIDDEDGLLRDHDSIAAIGLSSNREALKSPTDGVASTTDNIGTLKRKRFTFSRSSKKSGKNVGMEYAVSSEVVSGGKDGGDHPETNSEPTPGVSNADIVRRMAQHLEVLSLVEDDMALPKYSKSAAGGTSRTPLSPSGLKSPRRLQGGAGIASGRFGRAPMPSDLAGFEYRPPSYQQLKMHGGGTSSISGTASTSIMGYSVSDDVSIRTGGDETTTTLSSRYSSSSTSTVPTLSKSKRDSSSSAQKSSRSRFLQQQKKKHEKVVAVSPARANVGGEVAARPPRFPQQHTPQIQPIYDPFSVSDADDDNEEDSKTTTEEPSIASDSPVVNYHIPTTPSDDDTATAASSKDAEQPPRTPEDAPGVDERSTVLMSPETEIYENDVPVAQAMDIRSSSEDEGLQTAENIETAPSEEVEKDEGAAMEYARQLDVSVAVNEDLTCEYHRSKLSSLSVEGTVQIRVQTSYKQERPPQQQQPPASIPFFFIVQDQSGHVKSIQENNKFAENATKEGYDSPSGVIYTIKVPEQEDYVPVLRYKCDSSLRPVPIVSLVVHALFHSVPKLTTIRSPPHIHSVSKAEFAPKENSAASPSKLVPTPKIQQSLSA
jgi:hypothetical protein